jgi:hypothetical protein
MYCIFNIKYIVFGAGMDAMISLKASLYNQI